MNDENDHNSGCLVCGADLVYDGKSHRVACALCGEQATADCRCRQGHFVCDRCHGLPAVELIERTCAASDEADPLRLADSLMRNPAVKMHGPEHHFLVPAVLITAWFAVRGGEGKAEKLAAARRRAADVKGGFCGFHGTCGAAMGAGIAFLNRHLAADLPSWRRPVCTFAAGNRECLAVECRFYPQS